LVEPGVGNYLRSVYIETLSVRIGKSWNKGRVRVTVESPPPQVPLTVTPIAPDAEEPVPAV